MLLKKLTEIPEIIFLLSLLSAVSLLADDITFSHEENFLQNVLEELGTNKINVNSSPEESLLFLPYMDKEKAKLIIDNRPYSSVDQALLTGGFSPEQMTFLREFMIVEPLTKVVTPVEISFGNSIVYKDYSDSLYRAQPFGISNYFKVSRGKQVFSASAGLDAGENGYPDFLNVNILYRGKNFVAVAGTQKIWAGAGLVFGGSGFGTVIMPSNPYRISPYSGNIESGIPHGFSVQYETGKFSFACLTALRFYDATLDSNGTVLSLHDEGYHVTWTQKNRKRNFWTAEADFAVSYESTAAVVGTFTRFKSPVRFESFPDQKEYWAIECILNKTFEKSRLFAELSFSHPGDFGAYFAFSSYIGKARVQLSLLRYAENFICFFSDPPSELGANNEQGIISSLVLPFPIVKTTFSFSYFQEIRADSVEKKYRGDFDIDIEKKIAGDMFLTVSADHRFLNGKYNGFPGIRPKKETYSVSLDFKESSLAYYLTSASDSAFSETGEAISVKHNFPAFGWNFILSASSYSTPSFASVIYIYQPQNPGSYGFLNASGKGETLRIIARKKTGNIDFSIFADIAGNNKAIGVYFDLAFP